VITKKISELPSLDIKENDYFEIKKEYFEGSGLFEKNMIIYPCNDFKKQWKFLKDEVIEKSSFGWIIGPPGTGKSVCAFSFLLNLNFNEWKITWFHLPRSLSPLWLQINENFILKGDMSLNNDIEEILQTEKEKQHIVFIDGYKSLESHSNFLRSCHDWLKQNKEMNRLVVICSMTSRGKTNNEDDKYFNIKEFFVNSWKIDEYYQAVQNEEFFNSIEQYLDSSQNLEEITMIERTEKERIKERIDSKYYFAGGSSRFMFGYKTEEVLETLAKSIDSVGNIMLYIENPIAPRSDIINRLFNVCKEEYKTSTSIVSQYASDEIALKSGTQLVESLYKALKNEGNPAMEGWMLEMWFFASIKKETLKIYDNLDNEELWPSCIVSKFDPENPVIDHSQIWLKPLKWNQGGYDAVYVDKKKNYVKFVQITKGKEHSFKIQYFYSCLEKFSDLFVTKNVEIYILVTKDNISSFKIGKIQGQGLLTPFNWKKGDEKTQVKIRWMKGMYQ
jgi:KaiC/GvpD/RAD55 family RecA-like ATPase